MLRNQKGITLVALVVTIVVLIILATITISVVMNTDLLGRAEDAREHQANALKYDEEFSANTAVFINDKVTEAITTDAP